MTNPFSSLLPGLAHATVTRDLAPPDLVEAALRAGEGHLAEGGPLVVRTGDATGRSPDDRYLVRDDSSEDAVAWGEVNRPMEPEAFERLRHDMNDALDGRTVQLQTLAAGADPSLRTPVTVVTERAWHALFAHNLFLRDRRGGPGGWTVLDLPSFAADPDRHGTRSSVVVALDLRRRLVLIGGTGYGGEIKKSIFTSLNYALPDQDVLPMHCSANAARDGRVALFFGLSGTGKTTLSADPDRSLIGDDEHAWSTSGISNLEGGCYAKVIHLSPDHEPEIHAASTRFGTVLENVVTGGGGRIDFADAARTENTRAAYPLRFVTGSSTTGMAGHPDTILFLTADAFGVLPPLARLSTEQAMAHFLSGYTAKVAGTERGVDEPSATFSACFGAPFLPRPATVYAGMLGERLERHGTRVWMLNTGWTGGRAGVGHRIPLPETRGMVRAVLSGALDDAPMDPDPAFGLRVPRAVPDVDDRLLRPRDTWDDVAAYDRSAAELARRFRENFAEVAPDAPQAWRDGLPGA
ncbi:MAG: phosphoenolpyruvate carboxykinase [Deinococcus-Thermus bacterium]|jgi:phosphoenolpyruvate carboxykinase (ATP)|nr:phosphoenolpyruvate carboxykinase [Deinococcota bacterium]